ncbi:hypothetical protein SS05631_a45590 (plasmid) [Sinorhizobium sp. CCBAU 05631]|nr:hypothetical protein SS05631_a45590 [Sinorhizobium sp. CCBAU 05631]
MCDDSSTPEVNVAKCIHDADAFDPKNRFAQSVSLKAKADLMKV